MIFKEALPLVILVVILAPHLTNHLFAGSTDNAGLVYRLNAGSVNTRRLFRVLRYNMDKHNSWCLADWNDRNQEPVNHADLISKAFTDNDWTTWTRNLSTWTFACILHDLTTNEFTNFTFRMPSMN